MRISSVDEIRTQAAKKGLPLELQAQPDGAPEHCFIVGTLGPRLDVVAEAALAAAEKNGAPGVLAVGLPQSG